MVTTCGLTVKHCLMLAAVLVMLQACNHAEAASLLDGIPIPGLDLFDNFINNDVMRMLGLEANYKKGIAPELKDFALSSVDDPTLYYMNLPELIEAAGFKQESYKAVADDGYVTSLTRIVNPKADKSKLKWPPILLMHGGTIDPTSYLMASTKEHHPEKYPRTREDGPITSYNRSLGFVLANHGWDVFLAETRGSNELNMDHIKIDQIKNALNNRRNQQKNMTQGEAIQSLLQTFNYWGFSADDIIEHEIKSYINKICQIIIADGRIRTEDECKVNMFAFSLSSPLALGFLATRPDYAREKIHRLVLMAPTFLRDGVSPVINYVLTKLCPLVPNSIGVSLVYELIFTQLRNLIIQPAHWKPFRYSGVKWFTTLTMGPSAKYRTLIEMNTLHHLMRAFGFKQAKQMCQQMRADRLQKYDYGPIKNMKVYNSTVPPEYDLSNLLIKPYLLVTAENDRISAPNAIKKIVKKINPKPDRVVVAPQFNHLDLIAGAENDKYVNLPILQYFEDTKGRDPREKVYKGKGKGKKKVYKNGKELEIDEDEI